MDNNLFDYNETKESINKWAKNVLKEIKSAFGIGTESSVMKNEVGKYLAVGTASGLQENDKLVVKAFGKMLEKLKYQRKLDIISEDEYYSGLEKLRDRYFSKGTQNWTKYTEQIYSYQKKALEEEKEQIVALYDDVSQYALERIDNVIEKQANLQEKLKNVGEIYQKNTVNIDGRTDSYYSMRDLDSDIKVIERYVNLLGEFSQKSDRLSISGDIKNSFLEEIKALDIDKAIGVLTSLSGSDDLRFSRYLDTWNTKNLLSEAVSKNMFSDELKDGIDDAYSHMKEVLEKAGYEIPDGFFTSGSISAQKFGDAFVEKIEEQMQRIRAIIDDFNAEVSISANFPVGNTYNTSNTSYNISSTGSEDTVEKIRRYETIKRLSGVN